MKHIEITIKDLAGNQNTTGVITFKQDLEKPKSVVESKTNDKEFNTPYVVINATAWDPGIPDENASGIATVQLLYRHSLTSTFVGSWELFDESNKTNPSWNFTANEGGGYYELATRATDNIGNVEDQPEVGDVKFILDNEAPELKNLEAAYWFNKLPEISILIEDDFRLKTIEYRPNFESEWTTVKTNINQKTFQDTWELKEEYWDEMTEGEEYYLYFRLIDTLENTNEVITTGQAVKIGKDITNPIASIEIPSLETEWSLTDKINITAYVTDGEGSGVKNVELYYRFSEDNKTWTNWTKYGETLSSEPYTWEFIAEEGNGYYKFKIMVEDHAGNAAESSIFSTGVNIFPWSWLGIMVGLVIALIILITIIYVVWKKKE